MASEIITFKLVVEKDHKDTGDIRRVTLASPVLYPTLVGAAKDLLHADELKFRYLDDDGDRIVVSSQYELETAIGLCGSKNVVRLFVEIVKEAAEKPKEEEKPKVEEKPKAEEKKVVDEPKAEEKPAEEKKPEAAGSAAAAPAPEQNPFAELLRNFRNLPGVGVTRGQDGSDVVDIDFSKLFSAEGCEKIWANVGEALNKVAEEQKKEAEKAEKAEKESFAPFLRPDESAGVYSHVIHALPETVVHHGVICDGCGKRSFCGMRYKCAHCPDYDLCQDCIRRADVIHDPTHMFYPICFPCRFPGYGRRTCARPYGFSRWRQFMEQAQAQAQAQVNPQPEPEPKPESQPQPQPQPEAKPDPEHKEEAPKINLRDARYAHLRMTEPEMETVSTLVDMGFPDVEADVYFLRCNHGVINDMVIEELVRRS